MGTKDGNLKRAGGGTGVLRRKRLIAAAAGRLADRHDEVAVAILEACRLEIPYYAGLVDHPRLLAELAQTSEAHTAALLQALADTTPFAKMDVTSLASFGHRRFAEGIPLSQVLDAYHVGTQVVLRFILDELSSDLSLRARLDYERLVGHVAHLVFKLSWAVSRAVTDLYAAAESGTTSPDRDEATALADLLEHDRGSEANTRAASRLRFEPGAANVCVVISSTSGAGVTPSAGVLGSIALSLPSTAAPLVVVKDGEIIAVIPVPPSTTNETVVGSLLIVLADIEADAGCAFASGVGRVCAGIDGIAESYRQAKTALAILRTLNTASRTLTYERALPYALLASKPDLVADIIAATVGPLVAHDERSRGIPLMKVLDAYLEAGGSRNRTANLLDANPKTVDRRLDLIEEITGISIRDRTNLLPFVLGVLAARLLRPHEPCGPERPSRYD